MNSLHRNSLAIITALLPLSLEAETFRWTDAKGVIHYSNTIPASDSQLGHDVLSKSAIKKKTVISAKKNRQIKELAELREKQKKLAKNQKKEKAIREEEEIRLLSLYSSEEEIVSAYNSKLRRAQLTIDLLKSRHRKQSELLSALEIKQEESKVLEHKHTLGNQIDKTLDNLSIYQQAITENMLEKDRVRKEFKNTLSHYKKLIEKILLQHLK